MAPPDLHESLTQNVRLRSKQSRAINASTANRTQAGKSTAVARIGAVTGAKRASGQVLPRFAAYAR